jgi:hypothetical protein
VILAERKGSAEQQPRDPLAQFGWAFAAYRAAKDAQTFAEHDAKLKGTREALSRVPSPRAYEYARLRFLIENSVAPVVGLLPLGKRLLSRNPGDSEVKYFVRRLLSWSPSLGDKTTALQYARDLVKVEPQNGRYRAALGAAYKNLFDKTGNPALADNAIAAYRESIQLSPPNSEWREWAEHLIKGIEQRKRRRTGGKPPAAKK